MQIRETISILFSLSVMGKPDFVLQFAHHLDQPCAKQVQGLIR